MTTNTDLADALREIANTLPLGSALVVRLAADRLTTEADTDGWIEWDGEGRPIHLPKGAVTETRHRGGDAYTGSAAMKWDAWYDGPGFWVHDGTYSDIVAYRIVK